MNEIYTREYFLYCVKLLIEQMRHAPEFRPILFEPYRAFARNNSDALRVGFQVEHTLVKPGGRDSAHAIPGKVAIENSDDVYLVRVSELDFLKNCDLIIDYSFPNLENLNSSGSFAHITKKLVVISPLVCPTFVDLPVVEKQYDTITLFIDPEQLRRKRFLESLREKAVSCVNVSGVFRDIVALYKNTRILVNIRQTDHHDTLEELRILPALLNGVVVVSEIAPLHELTGFSDFVVWGKIEELPEIVRDVQLNYEHYRHKIFGGRAFLDRINDLTQRNQTAAIKAMKILGIEELPRG